MYCDGRVFREFPVCADFDFLAEFQRKGKQSGI